MVPVLIINDERVSYSDPIFAAVRSGQILSYDYYDNHLDDSSKIIDDALELRNFQLAGISFFNKRKHMYNSFSREALSQIWSQLKIDNLADVNESEDLLWASEHIHLS
ncbi:unnamed protein product [Rotaria socialis]|uniref:Uncharacterized protein n=1 Tax=Rotaria socialis TaxID=392032 RepID=A0A820Z362_9BILA|nr:unnamed protein product [Rotaria socialis]CAF4557809.1 unnamed protein product [Rotaria socialis]